MSLKKSDKIIALVGVVILIIAGIGIVLYSSDDVDGVPPLDNEDSMTFDISYMESAVMSATPDNTAYSIKSKLFNKGISPYVGNVVISQQNLKSIKFYLKYNDDVRGFLFGKLLTSIGADTLTVSIKDSEDNVIVSASGKGYLIVNETIDFNSMISLESIEAKDMTEAKSILEERYIDNEESYTIKVSLKTGLWGRFRELLKPDTFMLEITYTYYEYSIEGIENGDSDEPDNNYPPLSSNMGLGVYSATNFALTKL